MGSVTDTCDVLWYDVLGVIGAARGPVFVPRASTRPFYQGVPSSRFQGLYGVCCGLKQQ